MYPDYLTHSLLAVKKYAGIKKPIKYQKAILLVILICAFNTASAQHRSNEALTYGGGHTYDNTNDGYAIVLGSAYDVPLGDLGTTFKPAINYNFSVLRFFDGFTANATIGYHDYKPKYATEHSIDDETNAGGSIYDIYLSWKSFSVYSAYVGLVYTIDLTDNIKIYGGANIGAYYTHYGFHLVDDFEDNTVELREQELYFAPKLGFNIPLSQNFGINLESKYNMFSPSGSSLYNNTVGTIYRSVSNGFSIVYKL